METKQFVKILTSHPQLILFITFGIKITMTILAANFGFGFQFKLWFCWVSKMVINVYGVNEGEALCDRYTNHVMSPAVLAQKFKIQSERFHQTFRAAGMLKAHRKTTLRYQISSSARR